MPKNSDRTEKGVNIVRNDEKLIHHQHNTSPLVRHC